MAKRSIKKGELFRGKNIVAKRTGGTGISPMRYRNVYGARANKNYNKDEIIKI